MMKVATKSVWLLRLRKITTTNGNHLWGKNLSSVAASTSVRPIDVEECAPERRTNFVSITVLLDGDIRGAHDLLMLLGLRHAWAPQDKKKTIGHFQSLKEGVSAGVWLQGRGNNHETSVLLKLVEVPWVSSIRRLLRGVGLTSEKRARLVQIGVEEEENRSATATGSHPVSLSHIFDSLLRWAWHDSPAVHVICDPTCVPEARPSKQSPLTSQGIGLKGVREIAIDVVGVGLRGQLRSLRDGLKLALPHRVMSKKCVDIWPLCREEQKPYDCDVTVTAPVLRILPSPVSTLVLQVNDLEVARSALIARGIHVDVIGKKQAPQLVVQAPETLRGLELRLCASSMVTPDFAEGNSTLMEGVIVQQPNSTSLVKSSASDGVSSEGDCWMEFRAMLKNPMGFIRK